MAHHQLSDPVAARAALDRLRDLMKKPPHSMHEEALAFLAEAEMLRSQLQDVLSRTNRLIAILKQQRRQNRALQAAAASLLRLQPRDG